MNTTEFNPPTGIAQTIAPRVRRILAPNPSPMTYRGTNTYLVGQGGLAIIDPGPLDDAHLAAILKSVGDNRVSHILVTHSHLDHSPLARPLADATGAPILAFGPSNAGRSSVMQSLALDGLAGGGEGVDVEFTPDVALEDGETIDGDGWEMGVIHTPGHMGNHIALSLDDSIFTGDLIMGWASSLVSPPDGDLDDFLASCHTLKARRPRVLYPAHGAPIDDPRSRIDWLIDHRNRRTQEIIATLQQGPQTATSLAQLIYHNAPPGLLHAATRNVFAHLISLHQAGRLSAKPSLQSDAVFSLN